MGDQTKVVRDTTTYYLLSRDEIVALSSDLGAFSIVGLTIPALLPMIRKRPLYYFGVLCNTTGLFIPIKKSST